MTSDDFENTQDHHAADDVPIDDARDLGDDDYFVLEVEDEVGDEVEDEVEDNVEYVLDSSDSAPEAANTASAFAPKNDGFHARSEETGEEPLFDDDAFEGDADGDDLFSDLDAASHIEAATNDVVQSGGQAARSVTDDDEEVDDQGDGAADMSLVLDAGEDDAIFAGLSDDDEATDSRWQRDDDAYEAELVDEAGDDFVETESEHATAQRFDAPTLPPAAPLPPPGYRPPVAKDPMSYGNISRAQLGSHAGEEPTSHATPDHFRVIKQPSDFEQDLMGAHARHEDESFPQSSGNWGAIDASGEFHLVHDEDELASGTFSAAAGGQAPQLGGPSRTAHGAGAASHGASSHGDSSHGDSSHGDSSHGDSSHAQWVARQAAEPEDEGEPEHDPIYGAPRAAAATGHDVYAPQGRQGMPYDGNYDHLEEMVHDVADDPATGVIGVAQRRNVWLRRCMTLTMAASVIVVGTVVFMTLRPDLPLAKELRQRLGLAPLQHAPLEVAAVPRPAVDTDFVVPPLAVVATSEDGSGPRSSTPKLAQISEKSRRRFEALRGFVEWAGRSSGQAALSYVASRQPAAGKRDPRTAPIGLPTDPLAGTTTRPVSPVEPLPTNTSGDPTTTTTSGEGLAAATDVDVPTEVATKLASSTGAARKNPPSISGGPHGWGAGILRGAQAFAQLENGHFFVGRVQKVEEEELVMTWGQAEISFLPGDLQKLLPLATQEVDILRGGPEGYVKLKNQNKIWGQILEDLPDVVTIQKGEHRIVIPKVAVAQVTKQKEAQVRLGRNDQDWSEDSLPQAEPDLPNVQVEPELQSGAIRVQLDSDTQKSRSDELRARIRKAVPVGPMR